MTMISVIIPLYNKQSSVAQTVRSVLNQTFADFELIIVDDGSTDNSLKVVESIKDSRIRIIRKKNGGVSSARNEGIRQAKYDYVAFLDADDLWDSEYLETQVRLIQDFPNAKMFGTAYGISEGGELIAQTNGRIGEDYRGYVDNRNYFFKRMFLYFTSIVVIDKRIFDEVDMFDERISCGEDLDLWWRIILKYHIAFDNTCRAYYKQDSENRITLGNPKLESHFIFFIEKYEQYYAEHPEFKKYLQHEVLGHLYKYFLADRKSKEIHRILEQIDFSLQPFSYRVRYFSPELYRLIYGK